MKANDLLVKPNLKLRARRKADTTKPKPTRPNQWWGTDMTKVMIEGFGWVYLLVVLDCLPGARAALARLVGVTCCEPCRYELRPAL